VLLSIRPFPYALIVKSTSRQTLRFFSNRSLRSSRSSFYPEGSKNKKAQAALFTRRDLEDKAFLVPLCSHSKKSNSDLRDGYKLYCLREKAKAS
jgi:hypothetical protein